LGIEKSGQPHAEYWLGAHPAQPAEVEVHGVLKKLNELIEADKDPCTWEMRVAPGLKACLTC
jgi:mannose-6-phosphate isomerase